MQHPEGDPSYRTRLAGTQGAGHTESPLWLVVGASSTLGAVWALGLLGRDPNKSLNPSDLLLRLRTVVNAESASSCCSWYLDGVTLSYFSFLPLPPRGLAGGGFTSTLSPALVVDGKYRRSCRLWCILMDSELFAHLYNLSSRGEKNPKLKSEMVFLPSPGAHAWERPRRGRSDGPRTPDAKQAEPPGGGV